MSEVYDNRRAERTMWQSVEAAEANEGEWITLDYPISYNRYTRANKEYESTDINFTFNELGDDEHPFDIPAKTPNNKPSGSRLGTVKVSKGIEETVVA